MIFYFLQGLIGTRIFMAPEMFETHWDQMVDSYSLGVSIIVV